jgi:hypothetical protein
VIGAFASNVEHLVDDADVKVHGATLEPISQCPATASRTFHHDGLQKDRRAEAIFHFDPPRDGCYLIEQRTEMDSIRWTSTNWSRSQNKKCEASSNTKVHVHYCKGLQAVGTVDQTPKTFGRQPQDQWKFIAALQFHAGHPGNVTLSNEGTEPGTLTVFDQVRFTWSGQNCLDTRAHPRRAEIRMIVDFENVADRLTIFGIALKKRLADMASVPENSLRLTDFRPELEPHGGLNLVSVAELVILPSSLTISMWAAHRTLSRLCARLFIRIGLSSVLFLQLHWKPANLSSLTLALLYQASGSRQRRSSTQNRRFRLRKSKQALMKVLIRTQ